MGQFSGRSVSSSFASVQEVLKKIQQKKPPSNILFDLASPLACLVFWVDLEGTVFEREFLCESPPSPSPSSTSCPFLHENLTFNCQPITLLWHRFSDEHFANMDLLAIWAVIFGPLDSKCINYSRTNESFPLKSSAHDSSRNRKYKSLTKRLEHNCKKEKEKENVHL